jgi:stearoyl-CoA desaturase (delta-9 desaturase)
MQLGKKTMPIMLFFGQLIAMFSIVPMIVYASTWQWLITIVVYFGIMTFGLTMGYHRYLSHNHFKCNKWLEILMLFFAHIMMVGSAILWVATHRAHHKYSDTEKDPHSPKHKGYFYCYFLQVFTEPNVKYAGKILKNPLYKLQHNYYWEFIILFSLILYIIDPFSIIYAWLAPAGFAKIIGSLVFSYSHRKGEPHSDLLVGVLTAGEGFHKEHHTDPRAVKWHPLDIGGHIIKMLEMKL